MQRITGEPTRELTEKLEDYKYLSLEYLMIYMRFTHKASRELLLLFLRKIPNNVDELFNVLDNPTSVTAILKNSNKERAPLPTAAYYEQIIDAFLEETDETLATNLLRYLLFFRVEEAHKTAIPYLIERYRVAPQSARENMISPYCYNATTIFLNPSEIE
jgi:hypothetical protein